MLANREFRLFLSSTFRDLLPEREVLVKKIFPQIRALCRERGVEFTEIDLRWGITEEESRSGQTIRICLEEIDRCRPYFIGILGSRYGWIPEIAECERDPRLFTEFPWLRAYVESHKSIIEMEIAHGALSTGNRSAFFYEQAGAAHTQDAHALTDLKSALHAAELPCRPFATPEALGELVLQDLISILDRDWPGKVTLSPVETERARHAAFAQNRRQSYVANPVLYTALESHVENAHGPLVVWGPSGLGKSALLAHFVNEYAVRHPDAFLVQHFIGAAGTATAADLARHVMHEINDRYDLSDELPTDDDTLLEELPSWFAKIRAEDTLVLVVDALNQLTGVSQELHWLPEFIPSTVRLVVSTTPQVALQELRKRGWKEVALEPLTTAQVAAITTDFLSRYSKRLTAGQVAMISGEEKMRRPLFLRTVLEEVRVFGDFEGLHNHLQRSLSSANERELFQRVLERMEHDHGAEQVRAVLSAIWASRQGLTETEIMEITTLPRRTLSELMGAMEYHLMRPEERHTFFHNYLREAVETRYLAEPADQQRAHAMLGDYFSTREYGGRRWNEEPWQWNEAGDHARLREALRNAGNLALLEPGPRQYEALEYWRRFDRIDLDAAALHDLLPADLSPHTLFTIFINVVDLLSLADANHQALEWHRAGVPLISALAIDDEQRLWLSQRELLLLNLLGYKDEVIARADALLADEATARFPAVRIEVLDNLAHAFSSKDNFAEAERVLRVSIAESEHLFGADSPVMLTRLQSLATNLARQQKFDEAERLLVSLVRRAIEYVGSMHADVALANMQLASCRTLAGLLDGVEEALVNAAEIFARTLGPTHLTTSTCRVRLAEAKLRLDDVEGARAILQDIQRIMENKYPALRQTASWGSTLGYTYYLRGDYATALPIYERYYARLLELLGEDNPEVMARRSRIAEIKSHLAART